MADKQFLERLTATRGVSGYERDVQSVFLDKIRPHAQRLRCDSMGSVWGTLNAGSPTKVLLECHADEVGFIVRYISPEGLLYLQPVGSHGLQAAIAPRVVVKTAAGQVYGVLGTKPYHLQSEAERGRTPGITEVWVDIGARNAQEACQLVALGDPVSCCSTLTSLGGRRVSAPALDNRAGMYVVGEAFTRLGEGLTGVELTALASVQEEVGMRGVEVAAKKINPDVALVFDVCHTSDTPGIDRRLLGEVALGQGPVIVRGPNVSPMVGKRLLEVAEGFGIKYQIQPSGVVTSTDARVLQIANQGVAVGIVAIPIRYMHTPNEVLDWSDLEACVELAQAFVQSCVAQPEFTEILKYD